MPNPIKYTTGTETLALKKGNFYIGTGDVGKGPSDTTGFYQGVSPSAGGYVIYMNKSGAPGDLSYHNAANDSELISFTNNLAGQSYTTVNECLVYYASQTDKVVLNRDYEGIVTDGLVLNLDAGFAPSYPQSGTTWYNVGGTVNGTIINNPSFSSNTFTFDGTDDYINMSRMISADFTLNCWFKTTQNAGSTGAWYTGRGLIDAEVSGFVNDFGMSMGTGQILFGTGNPDVTIRSTTTYNNNVWHMATGTRERSTGALKLYVDGILKSTGTGNTNNLTSAGNITIGCLRPVTGFFSGSIAIAQIYSKTLTSSEVLQNYNAQKGRFGL